MNLIGKIINEDFGLETKKMDNPRIRIGARGIVFDKDNNIAIFNKVNKNEYKLPGGGIENNEDFVDGFKREILEETGSYVEITKELGIIEEERSSDNFKQISHVYLANVIKKTSTLDLTEKEKKEGARVLWMSLDEAILKVSSCMNNLKESEYEDIYHSRFIVKRDLEILKYYASLIKRV